MSRLRAPILTPIRYAPGRYRGVVWRGNKQKAYRIKVKKGDTVFYREFKDLETAIRVYDVAAKMVHGPDAKVNLDGLPPAGISPKDIRRWLIASGFIKL